MKNFIYFILIFFIFTGCQSAKDAFTLKKKSSADEFLVEKKSPLVLPPDYGKLPLPNEKDLEDKENTNNNIKVTSDSTKIKTNEIIKNSTPSSLEESIIEKIK